MEIKLDDQNIQTLVVRTIIETLTPEKARELIEVGLKNIISSNYEIQRQLELVIQGLIRDRIMEDEALREEIYKLANEAIKLTITGPKTREQIVEALSTVMADVLSGKRRGY